jgi:hypothetical protein
VVRTGALIFSSDLMLVAVTIPIEAVDFLALAAPADAAAPATNAAMRPLRRRSACQMLLSFAASHCGLVASHTIRATPVALPITGSAGTVSAISTRIQGATDGQRL